MRYILWVTALLEACDVTNNGPHLGRYLGFYQELEIMLKPREMVIFFIVCYMKNNTYTNSLRDLATRLYLFKEVEKACIFTQNGLTICYL